jgi:CRISPR-associated exonuclease Cas4
VLPLILFLLAIVLYLLARRARRQSGLPAGVVVYTDMPFGQGWTRAEAPLFSARLGLTGKPDYLVRRGDEVVPVEVKSMRAPAGGPHAAHTFQLAAYCALVAEAYGRRPDYGLIKYADQTLAVTYSAALEAELRALLDEIRADRETEDVPRSHEQAARCRACGFRAVCDDSLAAAE